MTLNKYLEYALRKAAAHDYSPHLGYRLCAVVVRGGSVLSVGYNRHSTNAFVEAYTDQVLGTGIGYSLSTHAEMDAVVRVRQKTDLRGSKMYVCRILKNGDAGISRPCPVCQHVIASYGIKRAYYTIKDNEYGVLKL